MLAHFSVRGVLHTSMPCTSRLGGGLAQSGGKRHLVGSHTFRTSPKPPFPTTPIHPLSSPLRLCSPPRGNIMNRIPSLRPRLSPHLKPSLRPNQNPSPWIGLCRRLLLQRLSDTHRLSASMGIQGTGSFLTGLGCYAQTQTDRLLAQLKWNGVAAFLLHFCAHFAVVIVSWQRKHVRFIDSLVILPDSIKTQFMNMLSRQALVNAHKARVSSDGACRVNAQRPQV